MSRLLNVCWWWLVGSILHLRYRVRVTGLEKLQGLSGPTLIMPNHPGYIDPALVLSHVRLRQPVRPVVRTTMYRVPFLYPLMRLIHALEVPDLSEQSLSARDRTLAMIEAVVGGLEQGECFLIYPAGRTQRDGVEVIGGNRAVADILARCPQANKVLVRTRGLWGSMFTRARTGEAPALGMRLLQGVGWLLANLLIFSPRRHVVLTVEVLEADVAPPPNREVLNPFLEEWYNREGREQPRFVPYHRWLGARDVVFPHSANTNNIDTGRIRQKTIDAVDEILTECVGHSLGPEATKPETTLDALGLDSLDRMDLTLRIEDRFGFRSNQVASNLGELWAIAEGLVAVSKGAEEAVPARWTQRAATEAADVLAENITEAFVQRALLHPDDVAVADRLSGVMSYRRMLVGTRLLSKLFRKFPGEMVGVMLPASVGADLTFLGLLMAGKLPVMLNWTLGPIHLKQAVERLSLTHIVTSRKLVDRLGIQPSGAEFAYLEDLRNSIGKAATGFALVASYLFPRRYLRSSASSDPDQTAVVLFTSGSESVPKAVPLSHRNLIANVRVAVKALQYDRHDRLVSFLPPFHSFGLMGTLVAPLITGMRMVHYSDPTHAAGVVRTIATYQATLMVTTPTFLGYILGCSTAKELCTLRVIVTGAEKCPEAIFARAAELMPGATILEGYGITECSPIVAANHVGRVKPGSVGTPVDCVEVCVVDPDSRQPLPANVRGMLLVRGDGVFRGYLRHEGPDPFVDMNGHRWYVTGDLVQRDDEGFIYFCGRLKRFLKVGGEMVSLPALEEPLAARWPPTDDGPSVAVEGIEAPAGRRIVLFATPTISVREANAVLSQAGFRGVMRLDEVRQIETIPVLGTGKTDYRTLRRMIEVSPV